MVPHKKNSTCLRAGHQMLDVLALHLVDGAGVADQVGQHVRRDGLLGVVANAVAGGGRAAIGEALLTPPR
ncbi:MAG: hypothetical protein V3S64_08595, partial [bacterium]